MFRALALRLGVCVLLSLQGSPFALAESPERLAGLLEAATISVDAEGISHVRANNEHDLYFLQGWVHARERLFQMDYNRRLASGTVAELVGQAGLPSDVQLRTLGLRRAAQRSYDAASASTRDALLAYAGGVNAWASTHALPVEYGALGLTTFAPWSAVDSIVIGKLISFSLSFELDIERTLAVQSYSFALGPQLGAALYFQDLWRSAGFEPDATVPDAIESGATALSVRAEQRDARARGHEKAGESATRLMRGYLDRVRGLPVFRGVLSREARGSSNLWAVSGALTQDGRPLIANDPHLQLSIPSTFFPMGLELQDEPVFGSTFPGIAGVIHGYNRYIAWGSTNNLVDVTDVFSEQVVPDPSSPSGFSTMHEGSPEWLIPIPQVFRANFGGMLVPVPPSDESGIPAFTLVMPRRDGGPIINLDRESGAALSVQYVGFGPTQEAEAFLMINRARNLEQFKDALQRFDVGSQNFVYAHVEGNIAYFTAGEVPVREDLQAFTVNGAPPWFVRNGQGGNEWLAVHNPQPHQATPHEVLPFAEMPQAVNPPAGWFVNGNNDPVGLTRDNDPLNQLRPGGGLYYLAYSWNRGFRAARINARLRELLETGDRRVSFEEMQAVQADVILRDAEVFKPYIVAAFDNASSSAAVELRTLAQDLALAQAVASLRPWDGSTPTSSVPASIYAAWRSRMIAKVIDGPLGMLPKPDDQDSLAALRNLLDNFGANGGVGVSGIDFFAAPMAQASDRRDFAILSSLKAGLELLEGLFGSDKQDDYRWGVLHRVALDHPLGGAFSIPPIPTDGGFQTVDAASHSARAATAGQFIYRDGPTHRSVYEPRADASRAASIWPGGTSGNPFSANYRQFLERWLTNQSLPLLLGKQEVRRSGAVLERYVPMTH
jgi:penicillin amidase